jgi:hypothetical protein
MGGWLRILQDACPLRIVVFMHRATVGIKTTLADFNVEAASLPLAGSS